MNTKPDKPKRFLSSFPNLMEEWDKIKNDEDPNKLTHGSVKKVWWLCKEKHHSYQAKVLHRTISRSGCPYCNNRLPSSDNNLAFLYPELLESWDYEKNAPLKPEELVAGSHKKVFWKCRNGHSWSATAKSRTSMGVGCPHCAGISKEVPYEQSLAALRPDFEEIWDTKKNKKTLAQIRLGSPINACFKGSCGHFWTEKVKNQSRFELDSHCPYCSGRKPLPSKNLGPRHDFLISEWDFSKNDGKPENYLPGSHAQIYWVCRQHGHKFEKSLRERAIRGHNCPFCEGHQVSLQNNLAVLHPEVLKFWHREKNKMRPEDCLPGSHKKVWWKCSRGHEWKTAVRMVARGSRCPKCSNQTSKPEIRIFCELSTIFEEVRHREKVNGIEVDVFLPEQQVSIEYDGAFYHEEKLKDDKTKHTRLSEGKLTAINVRERPLFCFHEACIDVNSNRFEKRDINRLLTLIESRVDLKDVERKRIQSYVAKKTFAGQSEFRRIVAALPAPLIENSLETNFPEVAKQWHPEKNSPLSPVNFSPMSGHKVWWQCDKEQSHVWKTAISRRTHAGTNCPYCAGNLPSSTHNLEKSFPDVAKYFHPKLNGDYRPEDFTPKSKKKVWWACTECNAAFERAIYTRVKSPLCRSCSYKARVIKRKETLDEKSKI